MQAGVLEELQSLNTRLGRLMPPPDPDCGSACDGPQDSLIEARPTAAWALAPPESLSGLERRVTRAEDAVEAHAGELPDGLRLWQPTDMARRLAVQARHDMEALYRAELTRDIGARLPCLNCDLLDGSYTLFSTPTCPVLYADALRVFSSAYRSLARLCEEYARMACRLYGATRAEFRDTALFSAARIQPGRGAPLALLPSAPHMHGPIVTAWLGAGECLWDALAPSPYPSIRLSLPDATLATVDGRARLHYRFGEPEGSLCPRYRVTFVMTSRRARVADAHGPVLVTPMRADRAVVTRPLPDCGALTPALHTPVLCALHDMHARLQVCESRLRMERHERPFAGAHGR